MADDPAGTSSDPDEGVFTFIDEQTGDLIVQDVTHRRVEKTGEGQVAKGGGKVILVHGKDLVDVSSSTASYKGKGLS